MTRNLAIVALLAATAVAQLPSPTTNATVSGVVKDAFTGEPLANYNVSTDLNVTWVANAVIQSKDTRQVNSVTDKNGRYQLSGLTPGPYRIEARNAESFGSSLTRRVTVAGHDLDNIDFRVTVGGAISGKVVDENKEPVPNLTVVLVTREYFRGELGYFFKETTRTDDRGQYKLSRVEAGKTYYVMAERRQPRMAIHSEVPLDPRLRRRAIMRTFYPSSPDKEGAAAISIRPRENREGVDIEVKKAPSYCIEGVASPAPMMLQLDGFQPAMGMSNSGGMVGASPNATTGPEGKFRFCDLYPGVFRLTGGPANLRAEGDRAFELITIADQDLKNIVVTARPLKVDGEAVFDGPAPESTTPPRILISLDPLLRPELGGRNGARTTVPGTFRLSGLVPAEYGVSVFPMAAKGLYVKEITYGGRNALHEPINAGNAAEASGIRIVIGQDGANIMATVTDKDSNPVSQAKVIAMPANVPSDAVLQAALVTGETDQRGQFISQYLAPGKYYVVATFDKVDDTPESIARLWRARALFYELDLAPKATAAVNLKPLSLD